MRLSRLLPALATVAFAATACGPTCAETCRRYHAEDQCDAAPQGLSAEEAIGQCVQICEAALVQTGPEPSARDPRFDPENISSATRSPQIENEREAAAWMDCVATFTDLQECRERLDDQYCVPVF